MDNLTTYNLIEFKDQFIKTTIYDQIKKDFDIIVWNNFDQYTWQQCPDLAGVTPSELLGKRVFSVVPFYYISQLDINSTICDLGCGWNIYKKYLPTVVGIDRSSAADEYRFFDNDFAEENKERFDNVMSMNALHFISLTNLEDRLNQILKITKPGGLIFIMMNVGVLVSHTPSGVTNDPVQYIRNLFDKFEDNLICFELDNENIYRSMTHGSLRFILKKNNLE